MKNISKSLEITLSHKKAYKEKYTQHLNGTQITKNVLIDIEKKI